MSVEIITKEDLLAFKAGLISELAKLVKPLSQSSSKQWLKSSEVRKSLNVSPRTLQNLQINGTPRYTKIGGTMYYKLADITKLLEGGNDA